VLYSSLSRTYTSYSILYDGVRKIQVQNTRDVQRPMYTQNEMKEAQKCHNYWQPNQRTLFNVEEQTSDAAASKRISSVRFLL